MIERKILVQEARRLGIKVSQEELNQAISEIKKGLSRRGIRREAGSQRDDLGGVEGSAGRKIVGGEDDPERPPLSRGDRGEGGSSIL